MSAFDPPIHAGMSPKEYEEAMKSVREGDVVTVEFDVLHIAHYSDNLTGASDADIICEGRALRPRRIISIEPRPIEVGDRVEWCTEDDRYEGVVRFIDCDDPTNPDALVRTDSGQAHVWPLSTLTRVESDDAQ